MEVSFNTTIKDGKMRLDSIQLDPVFDLDTRSTIMKLVKDGAEALTGDLPEPEAPFQVIEMQDLAGDVEEPGTPSSGGPGNPGSDPSTPGSDPGTPSSGGPGNPGSDPSDPGSPSSGDPDSPAPGSGSTPGSPSTPGTDYQSAFSEIFHTAESDLMNFLLGGGGELSDPADPAGGVSAAPDPNEDPLFKHTWGTLEFSPLRFVITNGDINNPDVSQFRGGMHGPIGFGWQPGAKFLLGVGFRGNALGSEFIRLANTTDISFISGNASFMRSAGFKWDN